MIEKPIKPGDPRKEKIEKKKKKDKPKASIANKTPKITPPPYRRLPLMKELPKALIAGKLPIPKKMSPTTEIGKSAKKEKGKVVKPKVKTPSNKGSKSKKPMSKGKRGPGLRGSSSSKVS